MKKVLAILILSTLLLNCNSSNQKENELIKKENELLKRELEIQKKENQLSNIDKTILEKQITSNKIKVPKTKSKNDIFNQSIIKLKTLLNKNNWEIVKIDNYGNFSFDMGSASAGRVSGNLKDVIISIEHKPERPGCADICPPMEIIHFRCVNGRKCVTDPADPESFGYFNEGGISFDNLKTGKNTYKLLSAIKKNI